MECRRDVEGGFDDLGDGGHGDGGDGEGSGLKEVRLNAEPPCRGF